MLSSAATKTKISIGDNHDAFIRVCHFISSIGVSIAVVVIIVAHYLSILFGLALFSINRNLRVAVWKGAFGANLCTVSSWSSIPRQYGVCTATRSSCGSAPSAGSSSGETAILSRRLSVCHNLLPEGFEEYGHCCQAWRNHRAYQL